MQIHPEAHPPREGDQHRVEIRAEVTGPQRGLRYRWLSVLGECDPHESDAPVPRVQVEITRVSPYEPDGGPNTRAEIAGRMSGELTGELRVLIYARADAWYIQPTPYASHAVRPDYTWSTWTHTGSSRAALVVRPGFEPYQRLDVLPQPSGDVLACAVVDGIRR